MRSHECFNDHNILLLYVHVVSIVTAIRFSNDDKTCLACSSQDGNLSVFDLSTDPPSISCTLKGHTQPVNGKGYTPRGGCNHTYGMYTRSSLTLVCPAVYSNRTHTTNIKRMF